MKIIIATVIGLLAAYPHGMSQNITVVVRRECKGKDSSVAKEILPDINRVLQQMVTEGKLINARAFLDSPKFRQQFVVENETTFKAIEAEFEKRMKPHAEIAKKFYAACPRQKDTTIHRARLYPAIKTDFYSYAEPVAHVDEIADPTLNYNVVFDFTAIPLVGDQLQVDSVKINEGLADVGRILNLHLAAGIPKEKINFVLAIHGWGIFSFLSNEEYQKKYKVNNPNLQLINELDAAGVKFLLCGQLMNRLNLTKSMMIPQGKVTFSSKTTLTSYQVKGYAYMEMQND